ncbi:hypothetical protein LR48_Vigan07g199100 [Vigna angularis]|uniref:Uncharacterized protein n=1 Tax=Phaseolus angularis TaxID=3914 RepID=A0A0L9V093_PHAAN|nr:hypothetical protein LR48_Vigan07g199100 [Vigna angularis]
MASSSSSSRRKEKVARVTRHANPSEWISDEEIRGKFLFWRVVKYIVPHKYLNLQLFKKEGFLFQEWIAYQGLTDFVQMKGDCYPDLVEVFYTNLRVVNGVIHSRVKGVNITIDDNVWYKVDKQYLHDGLNKEEKLIAYVLTWLLLPRRFVKDKMSTKDVFLLNAIKTRIPTNWVAVYRPEKQPIAQPMNEAREEAEDHDPISILTSRLNKLRKGPVEMLWELRTFGLECHVPLYINFDDAYEIIGGEKMLNISCIQLWCMYMDTIVVESGRASAQALGRAVHVDEVFAQTHVRKGTNQFVDERSRKTHVNK